MRVVDARALELPLTGIGRYVASLLEHFPPGLVGVARPGVELESAGLDIHQLRPDAWNAIWNEMRLARFLRGADAYWATKSQVPWSRPRSCTVVSTVHDLLHRTHPHDFSLQRRLDLGNATRATVKRADVIAVTCEHGSQELRRYYGRAADVVIPPAPTVPRAAADAAARERARLAEAHPGTRYWVLAVGSLLPRKNLVRLADAVAAVPSAGLVVVGPAIDPAIESAISSRAARTPLVHVGYADQDRLAALYAAADVLALVSLVEGFGMPLLDARALGLPVVVSDRPPMPENGGPSAHVVNPLSLASIERGVRRALEGSPPPPEVLPGWRESAIRLESLLR